MASVSELFQEVKPLCVAVAKTPSKENITEAKNYFERLPACAVLEDAFLEYLLFPFKLALKSESLNEEQEIAIYECLKTILKKTDPTIVKENILLWGFNMVSIYFTTKEFLKSTNRRDELFLTAKKSEEQKIAVVSFLSSLLQVTGINLQKIYTEGNLPLVGHIISILISLTEKEKNKNLQEACLICLKQLSGYDVISKQYKECFGNYLACFFPGIALMFNNLFTSSHNQSQRIITCALRTFSFVICTVLYGEIGSTKNKIKDLKDLLRVGKKTEHKELKDDENKERLIKVTRNEKWFKDTLKHLNTIFGNVLPVLMVHKNVKVRKALLEFIETILKECLYKVTSLVPDFIDVLAKLSSDSFEEVSAKSKLIIESANTKFNDRGDRELQTILKERLQSLFLSLPRVMNGTNDDVKLAHLDMIKGYLTFYGSGFREVLYSVSHLETFLSALLQALELETTNIKIVEDRTSRTHHAIQFDDNNKSSRYFQKNFKHFSSSQIFPVLKVIIHLLTVNGDIDLVFDHLLTNTIEDPKLRLQTVLVLNEVIIASKNINGLDASPYIEQMVEVYLQDSLWKLPVTNDHLKYFNDTSSTTSFDQDLSSTTILFRESTLSQNATTTWENWSENTPSKQAYFETSFKSQSNPKFSTDMTNTHQVYNKPYTQAIPFEVLNGNVQLSCVLLEGFSIHASLLRTNYNILLIQTLYPVLEKVGSVNAIVSQTALEVLTDIASFCNYESVSDLLLLNSDYLVNAVTLQFRHLYHGSASPCVLAVILRLCNAKVMPVVCDAMENVFGALDEYQEEVAEDMMNVMKEFALAVEKWYNGNSKQIMRESNEKGVTDVYNDAVSLARFLSEYAKLTARATGNVEEEDDDGGIGDDAEQHTNEGHEYDENSNGKHEEEKKEETPLHFQIVITSMKKCDYYIAAQSKAVRLKALEVAYNGVIALRERENDLLPALHKIWPTIIRRLKEPDIVIVLKALDVVSCMVSHSGDFLRKRLSTEFIPFAIDFLKSHENTFTSNKTKFTQLHKAIIKLIRFLGDILLHLDLQIRQFCQVESACLPYLSENLHPSVQEVAVSTMLNFYKIQPEIVWATMIKVSPNLFKEPPVSFFPAMKFDGHSSNQKHLSKNVNIILDKIKSGKT